jgi:hypothetical protein
MNEFYRDGRLTGATPKFGYDPQKFFSVHADRNILWVIPIKGQSLASGATGIVSPGPALATVPLYPGRALMPNCGIGVQGGERISSLVDAVEMTVRRKTHWAGETLVTSMLNHLLQAFDAVPGCNQPKIAGLSVAFGGACYGMLKRGSQASDYLRQSLADIVEIANSQGMRVVVPCTIQVHGESDLYYLATRSQYLSMLRQWQRDDADDIVQITGQTARPIDFISQTDFVHHGLALSQSVQEAQEDAGNTDWALLIGPKYNLPRAEVTGPDSVHLNSASQNKLGQLFARAIFAEFCGLGWKPVSIANAYFINPTEICVECDVPVAPIVIDASGEEVSPNGLRGMYGFDVQTMSGVDLSISSIVAYKTAVYIRLASPPPSGLVRIGYAMRRNSDDNSDDGPELGARGLVRDSSASKNLYQDYVLRNWLIHSTRIIPYLY